MENQDVSHLKLYHFTTRAVVSIPNISSVEKSSDSEENYPLFYASQNTLASLGHQLFGC